MEKTMDKISWKAKWRIDKFKDPKGEIANALQAGMSTANAMRLYAEAFICTEEFEANIALNEGLQELIDIVCGLGTPTKWDNSNARLGVGDSNTAENATQTGLQAATNKTYKAMDTSLSCADESNSGMASNIRHFRRELCLGRIHRGKRSH